MKTSRGPSLLPAPAAPAAAGAVLPSRPYPGVGFKPAPRVPGSAAARTWRAIRNGPAGTAARLWASLFTAGALMAQTAEPPPLADDTALIAALEAEIAALRSLAWISESSLSASLGWTDNALLSAFQPLDRAFSAAEVEAILIRPRQLGLQVVAGLNGHVLRYVSSLPAHSGEQQWTLYNEIRWTPVDALQLGLKTAGYWQDSVIDLSESEAQRFVEPIRVRAGAVTCAPLVKLPARLRLEPAVQLKRHDYRGYAGDYDDRRGAVRLEWRPTSDLTLSAGGHELRRRFDHRLRYTAGGRPLPGTRLEFRQREFEMTTRLAWGSSRAWAATIRAARLWNRDRASGYFDHRRTQASAEVEWQRSDWRGVAWIEGARTDYRTQTVGTGISPPARLTDDYETVLRLERTLGPKWLTFAEHRWQRSRSNQPGLGYRANTLLAGVRRSF